MEAIAIIAIILIIIAAIGFGLRISARIKNNGKIDDLISFLREEIQKNRQLHIYLINWDRERKNSPNEEPASKQDGINSIGFRPLPDDKYIKEKLEEKRPVTVEGALENMTCREDACTTQNLKSYLICLERLQAKFYRDQIKNWWDVIISAVLLTFVTLFSITIAVDSGFGIITQVTMGIVTVIILTYLARCYNNEYEVFSNEMGSKRSFGIPVGDVGQGKRWLWWKIDTVIKEPSTDHVISVDFEDVPIPIKQSAEKDGEPNKEKIPNIDISIKTLWRYANLTKALQRIGSGETANENIKNFLKGQIRALINVYFAEAEGDLQKIMQRCGTIGEDVDQIIQQLVIDYWGIDVDPVAVEPDTPKAITDARNDQAVSEYGIKTAQNKARAKVAELGANIRYLEVLKTSSLAIDESTMKAIVVGTVLKDTIVGIGAKLNLVTVDRGILDSVFNLFGKSSELPKGDALVKGAQTLDPEVIKKAAAMYDMFMKIQG